MSPRLAAPKPPKEAPQSRPAPEAAPKLEKPATLPRQEEPQAPVVTPSEAAPVKAFSIADLPPPLPSTDTSDEEDEDDSGEGESEAPSAPATLPASDNPEESDRWAGTMAHEWEEPANEAEASPSPSPSRLPAPAKTLLPKSEPEKPVRLMSLAEASACIPPDAAQYLHSQLRAEVTKVRPYKPTRISRAAGA